MTRLVRWILLGQVPPAGTRFYNPQNALQHFTFVPPGTALAIAPNRAIGNKILDLLPLLFRQFHPAKLPNRIYETTSSVKLGV